MTVCIAALCENGASAVVAADRMAVFGQGSVLEFLQDNMSGKIRKLDDRSVLLHAGASQHADAIAERLPQIDAAKSIVDRVEEAMLSLVREKRESQVRRFIGGDFNYERLLNAVTAAPAGPFKEIWDRARSIELGDPLLVTPLGEGYAIYLLRQLEVIRADLHYAAVGSGGIYAAAALTIQQYSKTSSLPEAMFQVYSAKKAAEIVYGVGEPTDMAALTPYGFKSVSAEALLVLERARTERSQFVLNKEQMREMKAALGLA